MIYIITILIIAASVVLGFFILVQNPKGGGLSGSFGNASTQVMGVKQSGDIMEKGTWVLMGTIALLCIVSVMFMPKMAQTENPNGKAKAPATKSAPAKK